MSKTKEYEPVNYFKVIMFFLTLGIMPLIVYYAQIKLGPEELVMMHGDASLDMPQTDMFSYYKSWMFTVCTTILGLNSLWDFLANNWKFNYKSVLKNPVMLGYGVFFVVILVAGIINNLSGKGAAPTNQMGMFLWMMIGYTAIFLPLLFIVAYPGQMNTNIPRAVALAALVFIMAVFGTTAFTEYRHMAFFGAVERYESVFALLGYIILLLEVIEFATRKTEAKVILGCLLFSATIIGTIGFFQLMGKDIFYLDFINKITLGPAYAQGVRLTPKFREAYATLYNPNCVGMYSSMLGPMTLGAGILWPRKSPFKYLLLLASVFGMICLVGSNSTGGLAGMFVGMISYVVLILGNLLKNKGNMKIFVSIFVVAVVSIAVALMIPAVNSKFSYMANKLLVLKTDEENGYVRDLILDENKARVKSGNKELTIEVEKESLHVLIYGPNGEEVKPTGMNADENNPDKKTATYEPQDWPAFSISGAQNIFAYEESTGYVQLFGIDGMMNIVALTKFGEQVDLNATVPSIGFEGHQLFASSRGYIWAKTIPLLKDKIIIGSGVDSYIMAFPQGDLLGKTRFFGSPYIIVDKAHNLYLQTATCTGVISVLALIIIFVVFLFTGLKIAFNFKQMNNVYFATLMGVMSGVIGYLISAMATDSTVSVAPMFWAVLGLGFACVNGLNKEKRA